MAPNSNSTVLPSGRKVTRTSFSGGIVFPVASLIGFRPSLPSCMCAAADDFAGAKQTAEKHRFRCENDEKHTSVAKATAHSVGVTPGINPRPTAPIEFFRSLQNQDPHLGDCVVVISVEA